MKKIEVCFTPALFEHRMLRDNLNIVIVDILRATTSICAAFQNGVKSMIPVAGIDKAREYKNRGYLVASERDGLVLDFADFGNSAFNFISPELVDKTIAYSTTNGTHAIEMVRPFGRVVIGSFLNITALSQWLEQQQEDVLILCAGWKQKFNLEDSFYAGALTEKLMETSSFQLGCDSAEAALDLWKTGEKDPLKYIDKALHRHRLKKLGLDDVLDYTFQMDSCPVVPVLHGDELVNIIKV